jgi:hypothetical protein
MENKKAVCPRMWRASRADGMVGNRAPGCLPTLARRIRFATKLDTKQHTIVETKQNYPPACFIGGFIFSKNNKNYSLYFYLHMVFGLS